MKGLGFQERVGSKCLQGQLHLHCINASRLWRRATVLLNCFSALTATAVIIYMLVSHFYTDSHFICSVISSRDNSSYLPSLFSQAVFFICLWREKVVISQCWPSVSCSELGHDFLISTICPPELTQTTWSAAWKFIMSMNTTLWLCLGR